MIHPKFLLVQNFIKAPGVLLDFTDFQVKIVKMNKLSALVVSEDILARFWPFGVHT